MRALQWEDQKKIRRRKKIKQIKEFEPLTILIINFGCLSYENRFLSADCRY